METPKNEVEGAENVEQKKELVEFDATPREELEKMATNLMSDQERAELQNGEVNLILRIARMNIERKEVPPSISDAIADAAILRLGVREFSRRSW